MDFSLFRVTGIAGAIRCFDKKGKRDFADRKYAGFILTLSGEIDFTGGGTTVTAREGCAVFLPKGLSYRNERRTPAESIVINFDSDFGDGKPLALAGVSRAIADGYAKRFQDLLRSPSDADHLLALSELYALAARLFGGITQDAENDAMKRVYGYLLQNYDKPITVRACADAFAVSTVYLEKHFRACYRQSVHEALTGIRMRRARDLLEEKRPVSEIALAVGYEDIYSFSRAFKRVMGVPPSVYKK